MAVIGNNTREVFPSYLESIKNIMELRARQTNDLTNGDAVLLVGFNSVGDKLGGTYVWNANSIEADDNRTVIIPDISNITARGRWVLANEQQTGNQGPIGDKGPRGDKGLTGDKGPTGNQGAQGEVGGDVVGSFKSFGGVTAPNGYLICDGSEVQQSVYPALYAVLGSRYGTAAAGNFKLPDTRGRSLLGATTEFPVGSYGGSRTHQISLSEMPAHKHGGGVNDAGTAMFSHNSFVSQVRTADSIDNNGNAGTNEGWTGTRGGGFDGMGSQAEGPGAAMDIMNPFLSITWLIKT